MHADNDHLEGKLGTPYTVPTAASDQFRRVSWRKMMAALDIGSSPDVCSDLLSSSARRQWSEHAVQFTPLAPDKLRVHLTPRDHQRD